MQNIQNTKNSLNAGRPSDPLEKITELPQIVKDEMKKKNSCNTPLDSFFEDIVTNIHHLAIPDNINYRDPSNKLCIDSSIITKAGSRKCGKDYVMTPTIKNNESNVIKSHPSGNNSSDTQDTQNDEGTCLRTIDKVTEKELYEIHSSFTEVVTNESGKKFLDKITGSLTNIKQYAECSFEGDTDQEEAFTLIASSFVMTLYNRSIKEKKRVRNEEKYYKELFNFHRQKKQFIAFLSGAGGTGKSEVINSVKYYCKTLCDNLNIEFNKRTIVVTALTGAAAVSINGETTAKACQLKSNNVEEDSAWEHTIMLIVDEISFATKEEIETLNKNLRIIRDKQRGHFLVTYMLYLQEIFFNLNQLGQSLFISIQAFIFGKSKCIHLWS